MILTHRTKVYEMKKSKSGQVEVEEAKKGPHQVLTITNGTAKWNTVEL